MTYKRFLFTSILVLASCICDAQMVLHFAVKYGFPMVKGEVNGKNGWFLLDTGTPLDFIFNNNYIPIEYNRHKGMGRLSSGQQFELCKSDSAIYFSLDGIDMTNVEANNGNLHFMEEITKTPSLLGFIGYGFLKDYKFVIDYKEGTCTLYSLDADPVIDNDKHQLLAFIEYTEDERRPQMPTTSGSIGGVPINLVFDTGASSGWIQISPQTNVLLKGNKSLNSDMYGTYKIKNLYIKDLEVPTLKGLHYSISATNQIILSYEFLRHYITVWDYSRHIIEIYNNENSFLGIFNF